MTDTDRLIDLLGNMSTSLMCITLFPLSDEQLMRIHFIGGV